MTGSMAFIDIGETVPDRLRLIEMHDVSELVSRQTGADDGLRYEVELSVFANVISFRHLAQISQTDLSDGPQLAVHHHETLFHHGLPFGILVTVKDGAWNFLHICGRHN